MDDRETLIRVEQQLKDSIQNQTQIIEDLRTIFSRIEVATKVVAGIKSDLKAHLESSPIRKEELSNRLKYIEERHTELKESYNKFKDEIRAVINKKPEDDDSGEKINTLEKQFIEFKTEIVTSVAMTRWIFGGIITLLGVAITIIELVKYFKGQ
jgi:hypothetical protein